MEQKQHRQAAYEVEELKRDVGAWGSFCMGYADVGANIYITLGIIALFALGATPIALALAAVAYVATGLSYAELASAYPVAGGAQFYASKAFGDFHGFVAGWGLMLGYTIDIALFALATVGYLGFLERAIFSSSILLTSPYFGITAVGLITALIGLNIIGIKWSSRFNEIFVIFGLATAALILGVGLPLIILNGSIWNWVNNLSSVGTNPSWNQLVFAMSLAMVSFIGIESISQAAEETRRPWKVIPLASKSAIVSVTIIAVGSSLIFVNLVPNELFASVSQYPVVEIASRIPVIGVVFALWVAFTGFAISYVSTNTGVIGVSRVMFSMGRLRLAPQFLRRLHDRYHTPYVTIALFSIGASLLILANLFLSGIDLLSLIASLYSFGALIAYMYVNLSMIVLRVKDTGTRPWKMRGNISFSRNGRKIDIPILPIFGFIATALVWFVIVGTNPTGRVVGAIWFLIGILLYFWYRRRSKLPLLRTAKGTQRHIA